MVTKRSWLTAVPAARSADGTADLFRARRETGELLAPARDLSCGRTAINCGADAVYIGAQRFGARAKVGNSLEDIEALARHAHVYWAKVYVTVNTILHDAELPQAVRLIHQLDDIGVDGVIIQDVGLLECDLPPLPLIASTQMHNLTPERVAFLEQVGFHRAILARELSLSQIATIRQQTTIELETFVHGALCVCYSGQCTMSYGIGGRSGNRGECAQPCRKRYSLVDREGAVLIEGRYLLSLRDLNLSAHLADLLDAGVTSFKIEGRLKDEAYVANVVSHYRRRLDQVLAERGLKKASSGQSCIDFEPDVTKTFNRGYTSHFLYGRGDSPGSIDTPKMTGEFVGTVTAVDRRSFTLETAAPLHTGDGLCFFDAHRELCGTTINGVHGTAIIPAKIEGIEKGTRIYRNHDRLFAKQLKNGRADRQIPIRLKLEETPEGFSLSAADRDGNMAVETLAVEKVQAENPEKALANARKQMGKTGGTAFVCETVDVAWTKSHFVPLSALNALRRRTLERLSAVREENRPRLRKTISRNSVPYPEETLTYLGNVLNEHAAAFYRRHGVTQIEPAAESGLDMRGRVVMRTKYCIKHELGLCPKRGKAPSADGAPSLKEPLHLVDEGGHRYELRFDCGACEMDVVF
jgi:collagenase-like PrtC family protease